MNPDETITTKQPPTEITVNGHEYRLLSDGRLHEAAAALRALTLADLIRSIASNGEIFIDRIVQPDRRSPLGDPIPDCIYFSVQLHV